MSDTATEQEKKACQLRDSDFERSFKNVLEAYTHIGYPPELIQQWTIPERDARTLMNAVKEHNPKHILEVGTFVGLTTQMLALHSSQDATIHTIDPNFPLAVEMSAMKSALFRADTTIKTLELALQASKRLETDRKIHFHDGGFSKENTFASLNANSALKVPVIGPAVCQDHGPFDFIFIDGLHYTETVFADLMLAAKHLTPNGIIALHDVIGRWGSNVRRAAFKFLCLRDDFIFLHDKYSKLYSSIGFLQPSSQKKNVAATYSKLFRTEDTQADSLYQEGLISNLALVLVSMFAPKSVLQLGCGSGELLACFKKYGTADVLGVETEISGRGHDVIPVVHHDFAKQYMPAKRYDLCICLGLIDTIDSDCIDNVIESCLASSDTIIFSFTSPGEISPSFARRKPIASWVAKFFNHGYVFHDVIRPYLEPLFYVPAPVYKLNTIKGLNIYLIKKTHLALHDNKHLHTFIAGILKEKESRIEDLILQNFSQSLSIEQFQLEENKLKTQNQQLKQAYHEIATSETYALAQKIQSSLVMKLYKFFQRIH